MLIRLLLASALAAGLASAQRGGGGGGGGGDATDAAATASAGMQRAQAPNKMDVVADKLHLNKDQKAQAATIFAAAQEAATPINEQIRLGRNDATVAILEGKTGDDLNKVNAHYADLLAQKAAVEAAAYGKLYAILDAKQQAKAAQVFAEQMDGMFDGGRGRGNRGGRSRQ
jgi:hypothetical protein